MKKPGGMINMQRAQKTIGEFHAPPLPAEDKFGGRKGLAVLLIAVLFLVSLGASIQARQTHKAAALAQSTSGK